MVAAVLDRPTLVMNSNWQPVGIATVAKALTKVWNEAARIVDPADYQQYTWQDWSQLRPADGDLFIQTRRFQLRVPEVVMLTKYDRVPTNAVTFSRRNVFKRDKFTCQYCGARPGSEELTIDHVTPQAQGGTSTWLNCVLACISCNSRKADGLRNRLACHCDHSRFVRHGDRCTRLAESASKAGHVSSARATGMWN